MPPFLITTTLEPPPRINGRQDAGMVVLSITKAYTTYTTTIDLSSSTAASLTSNPTTPAAPQIRSSSPSSQDTGVVIGAVLGSLLGLLVCITLFYKCCIDNRSAVWLEPLHTSYDSDSVSTADGDVVGTRGGGFGYRNRHGDRVRRPGRARTRRHSHRRRSESPTEVGYSPQYHRRRSSMTQRQGLLGWAAGAPRSSRRQSGWYGSRRNPISADD